MKVEYTYNQYSEDVLHGKIIANQYVILACQRYERFKQRTDMKFREKKIRHVINFISKLKHFSGKSNGKPFLLEPCQQFIVANIFGFYWKESGLRVCQSAYIEVARKFGKTSLMAAIALYCLIADGEAGAEVDVVATSREQARILFEMARNYISTADPKENLVKRYRNQLKFPLTKSVFNVFAADANLLDGFSPSVFICDETHAYQNSRLYDVLRSGQGFRSQPLAICITSCGFLVGDYFCYTMRRICIEILNNIKEDDSQFSIMYELDESDDWTDERVWIKSNPLLDVTVSKDWLSQQVRSAMNNPTLETSVKTKNLGLWCQTSDVWIPDNYIIKATKTVNLKDFDDCVCFVGVDLAQVSDMCAVSFMIPRDYKFYYKTYYYLPQETIYNSPNSDKYREWQRLGYLRVTPGNVTDYDVILSDIMKIQEENQLLIETVAYDSYNATQFAINATSNGLNMQPMSQSIGNFNRTCKEMQRLLLMGDKIIIDNNPITRWMFGNATLMIDHNENIKVTKTGPSQKIDGLISMLQAQNAYLNSPCYSYEI